MNKVNTVIEGCFINTFSKFRYSSRPFLVPLDARVLLSEAGDRFLLLDMDNIKGIKGEYSIEDFEPYFENIFDYPRLLADICGRVFLKEEYHLGIYQGVIPKVLYDCERILNGEVSNRELNGE